MLAFTETISAQPGCTANAFVPGRRPERSRFDFDRSSLSCARLVPPRGRDDSIVAEKAKFRIRLNASFSLQAPTGHRIEIKSKKSVAIIGALSRSPGFERRRAWIQALLWGSRDAEQASSSLRQELHKLKKLINLHGPLLRVERDRIWLDPALFEIDQAGTDVGYVFLEGIDIPGEDAFEDWLRAERALDGTVVPAVSRAPVTDFQAPAKRNLSIVVLGAEIGQPQTPQLVSVFAGSLLRDRVVVNLSEFGGVQIHYAAERGKTDATAIGADLMLRITCQRVAHLMHMSCTVNWAGDGSVLIATTRRLSAEASRIDELVDSIEIFASELVERILSALAQADDSVAPDRTLAAREALQGIYALFSRDPHAAQRSEQHFKDAIAIEDNSAFHAWRAYLAALFLEEAPPEQHAAIRQRAQDQCRKALELDPYNGLTLSLLTHVHAFVFRDFEMAGEFLQSALTVRPDHVMTQDATALLNFYKGNLETARAAAFKAENLGRFLPYRYCFATTQSMIETMAGNFSLGIRHAERASALLPSNNCRPYPPTLRYLGVCYAQSGDLAKADQAFSRLESLEGRVSSSDVEKKKYPVPSSDAAMLLGRSLKLLGR